MIELMKAIKAKANANATLSAEINSDIYYNVTPPSTGRMPWITYFIVTDNPIRTFDSSRDMDEVSVQFSIFDKRSNISDIEKIHSDLNLVFDRQVITYDNYAPVGSIRELSTGPERLQDCWMKTVDYTITFQT